MIASTYYLLSICMCESMLACIFVSQINTSDIRADNTRDIERIRPYVLKTICIVM